MLMIRIKPVRKNLAVMTMGRGYCISTDEPMVLIDADTVVEAIVIKPILFDPAGS